MKIAIAIVLVVLCGNLNAQSLFLYLNNGDINEYPLTEISKITYSPTEMIINQTDESQIINELSDIRKFNYALSTQIINHKKNNDMNLLVYPNPTANQINIKYKLCENSEVKISILDISGRYLNTISDENKITGEHHLTWDFNLENGNYFIHIESKNQTQIEKLIVLN